MRNKKMESKSNHTIYGYLLGNRIATFKGLDWNNFDDAQYIGSSQCPKTNKVFHHWNAWIVSSKRYTTVVTVKID